MNIVHLILLQFAAFGLLSVPLAHWSDPEGIGYLAQYTSGAGSDAVLRAYQWTIYSAVVLALFFLISGINRRIFIYQRSTEEIYPRRYYARAWSISFLCGLACAILLFAQNGFQHPGLVGLGLDYQEFALFRIEISRHINLNVYNLGMGLFVSFAMICAFFYLKSAWRLLLTSVLFIFLGGFSLAKAPMAAAVLLWLFFYLAVKRPSLVTVGGVTAAMLAILALTYSLSKFRGHGQSFLVQVADRVFYGQFADLPYYFHLFEGYNVSLISMLPPYLQRWMGIEAVAPPARLVMEYVNPAAVASGTAGVANTLFVGEACALGGAAWVAAAPFWVGAHFWVVTALFTRLGKNIWTAFGLAYLYYRMADAMISGFSYFLFSAIHIMLLAVAGLLLLREMRRKRYPVADGGRKASGSASETRSRVMKPAMDER